MGKFEDYINGLDGVENPNLTEVVAELAKLHSEEIAPMAAKIETQTVTIGEKDDEIAERDRDIQKWKSANWDLVAGGAINGGGNKPEPSKQENGLPDGGSITLDDLFQK